MAIDFIPVDVTTRLGARLRQAIDLLTLGRDMLNSVANVAKHQQDGVSYVVLEGQFGLPAGKGATVVQLVNQTLTDLAPTHLDEMLQRLG